MREKENLTKLGSQGTEYKSEYDPTLLESFSNRHPGNDYFVKFNCPVSWIFVSPLSESTVSLSPARLNFTSPSGKERNTPKSLSQ